MSAELLDLARDAAHRAGALLRERARTRITGLDAKSSATDLVSDADRDAERLIVDAIRTARPDDAIVAEEGAGGDGGSGVRWLVDPLDGTINFLWGLPQWCVSIAAEDATGGLVGVVHDPSRGETFTAVRGGGARLGDAPIRLRPAVPLAEALVATGFSYRAEERARQARVLAGVLPAVRDVRRLGAAALDLAWLAAGRFDAYFETGLNPWDRAAGELIVREAGGAVAPLEPGGLVAGPPELVPALLRLVAP